MVIACICNVGLFFETESDDTHNESFLELRKYRGGFERTRSSVATLKRMAQMPRTNYMQFIINY